MPRIYLDNAATTWPKPAGVYQAMDDYQRDVGASAGRGAYDSAGFATREVNRARSAIAKLIGVGDASRVVFTASGTESLNLALFGLLKPGDHVVTTEAEHNSILRPLAHLRTTRGVSVDYASCHPLTGQVDVSAIRERLRPETRLVAITSASNVTGALNDLAGVADLCRERACLLLVDAAQTLGHLPLNAPDLGIDLLASPGHKGLLGPLGTGLLYIAPELEGTLTPLHFGGTGANSDTEAPPAGLPERYEAGNLNVPALAGLAEGVAWVADRETTDHALPMTARLLAELAPIPEVTLLGPADDASRAPVVSFTLAGYDPQEVAAVLATQEIECRAGLHCAPRMHAALGTKRSGGTIRLSPGYTSTKDEVQAAVEVVRQLASTC